ncbi:putative Ig domain-containing protein [Govanella unica]|uniref:Ig domain-containing protein n=1 Tax=Govanella unica TaxID=2975056 RepID=A0A9X3TY73_9PROT|nr:putative Ig domain-containing protein [Govania unica]MDA5193991.1 putative Ig domain-containing protein [Govania unica]
MDAGSVAAALPIPTDPNFGWHLNAINIKAAWADYTGKGVVVGVVDDGVNYLHSDLASNYNSAIDWDSRDNDADAYPSAASDYHGTKVAGVIAAAANGIGGVGVAYNAEIAGFRIGFGSAGNILSTADALLRAAAVSDVVNSSWAYTTAFQDNFKLYGFAQAGAALQTGAATGRDGLGTIFVFSGGNDRATGQNVNYHNFANSPYAIAVAATTTNGVYASYSNPGAALLISAPGDNIQTTLGTGGYGTGSGTSFAAPVLSGVVALMLEANASLGYRDVKEILAYSARLTDAGNSGWSYNGADNWNGGGLHFNHNYGFGLVDATAAVCLAETWGMQHVYANMLTTSLSATPKLAIPDGNANGVTSQISVAQAMQLDTVQIDIDITHTKIGDLTIILTSPDGTRAVLVDRPGGADNASKNISFTLSANNFWGEDGKGIWKLTVIDNVTGQVGTLNSWKLILTGDTATTNNSYIYTNDYANLTDAARQTLADTNGGIDTINASAVSGDSYINLNAGMTGTLAGKPFIIAVGTVIENVYLGDGNDIVIGNSADNIILGGRGDDYLDGGDGIDTAKYFGTLDNFDVIIVSATMIKVNFIGTSGIDEGHDTLVNFELFDFGGTIYTYQNLADMFGTPIPINHAPIVATLITDQSINEKSAWSFTVPAGTFTDEDGDKLIYTATLADGTALPSWLTFNATTSTFSGTPGQIQVGTLDLKITATDPSGAKATDSFRVTINNVNDAPIVAVQIADQSINEKSAWSFTVPAGTFTDEDGDKLTYSATLADGTALPSWLTFNATTNTFSGTPGQAQVGTLDLKITATDPSGAKATDSFRITINNVNDAPIVAVQIADQSINEKSAWTFTVPTGTFTDEDGDKLTYSATLADGTALPSWLTFNATTNTFTGTPGQAQVGTLDLKVTATDPSGAKATDSFRVTINNVNDAPVLLTPLADHTVAHHTAFNYSFPDTTFTDADGDTLTYTATLEDGSALPSWLVFNAATKSFSGTPELAHVGGLAIKVTATDPSGAAVSDIFSLTVTNTRPFSLATLAHSEVAAATSVKASDLYSIGDADGDQIQSVQVTAGEGHTGHWVLDGANLADGTTVAGSDFARLMWVSGVAGSTDAPSLRVSDGLAWSDWTSTEVTSLPQTELPSWVLTDVTRAPGDAIYASELFPLMLHGDTQAIEINLWAGADDTGHWEVDGALVDRNITISLTDFAKTVWVVGQGGQTEDLWMRVQMGDGELGSWMSAWVSSSGLNHAPVIASENASIDVGAIISAHDLFTVTDQDGDAMSQYQLWSSDMANGHWSIDGQDAGHIITISSDDFGHLSWIAGNDNSTDHLWVRAHDGLVWSDWMQVDIHVGTVGVDDTPQHHGPFG